MARWNSLITWGLLLILLQVAVAQAFVPARRQESGTSTTAVASSALSQSVQDAETTASSASSTMSTVVTTTDSPSVSATVSSPPITPTGGSTSGNSSLDTATIPEGELPIEPKVTPGWAVAGVILLCTGVIYSLIGIKNTILHNAFSVAYVVGLGITVLVVYVMVIPVSNGSQGAYVVAAILPAIAVGALASWFFKEITECLGCALGGFCLSMWILCLHEGGLLSGIGKVIFIIAFSLVGFASYFTRWTRDWALMATISFSGATATVLGIDCFSRAGLKEFWAYIWDLNNNLFPQDTNTYPLTKGIRVEVGAILVIFFIGIISQKRLWNVIKDRRRKREEELAEAQRARDDEEANIGRELEARNARERRAWERAHGDYVPDSDDHDSGFARDSESEKAIRYSQSTATPRSHAPPVAEMPGSDVPPTVPPKPTSQGLIISGQEKDVVVTVRVATDETPTEADAADKAVDQKEDPKDTAVVQSVQEVAPVPEVVPLPFRFPDEEAMARDKEERSTIATFADDDEEVQAGVGSKRSSFAKRLSQSSAQLMRRVSQRTSMSLRKEDGDEELVALQCPRDDDAVSLAATIDTQSDSGAGTVDGECRRSIEINAQFSGEQQTSNKPEASSVSVPRQSITDGDSIRRVSALTAVTDMPIQSPTKEVTLPSAVEGMEPETVTPVGDVAKEDNLKQPEQTESDESQQPQEAKSTPSLHSTPLNLTQERLPPSFSNVALHYRTNEWAKHLSHAEAPEPETLRTGDDRPQTREAPAPVHVEELQQTALSATPAPTPSISPGPIATPSPTLTRPKSTQSASRGHSRNNSYQSHRRASSKTRFDPIAEEEQRALSRAPSTKSSSSGLVPGIVSSATASAVFIPPPPPPGIMSYDSPQSLIAQRSIALRNKTYGILTGANNMPEIPAAPYRTHSETGSTYNYPVYPSQMPPASLDDLPLSQRKEMIRRQSSFGTMRSSPEGSRSASGSYPQPGMSAENVAFDSHQPMRYSNIPSQDARDARLASFRDSVRADLRAGMASPAPAVNGRDMALSMCRAPSASNLAASQAAAREAEMQRNIDLQRSFMMSQKEAEAKRKEKARIDKERSDQAFTRSMQSGEMFELHREAMRKMQKSARDA
ncbi:hypothetical protein CORC01_04530 [Colletotrichum orchidophilum]|uniref:TM7S3/TM198-like domain-containing protein n=1 Tax=Colletotrichum orchidophilum TaxID=1209926 RepID=A0A1G4BFB4_9PEZI|nr:uncharacterized protein CORC01_04530 [Colletotrichum orchidophilum]OHF00122.1 hypothetical protein CORC01_04530 [Colletotrichum orchidophilum]